MLGPTATVVGGPSGPSGPKWRSALAALASEGASLATRRHPSTWVRQSMSPASGRSSFFFAAYFLTIKVARADGRSAGLVMARPTMVTTAALLVVVLVAGESFRPQSLNGLWALAALALVSQVGGQGLLAVALGMLPAAFSPLVIFLEAVAAALLGWAVLGEPAPGPQRIAGAAILAGVSIARPGGGRTARG